MGGGKDYYKDGDFGTFDTVFGGAGDDYFDGFDGGRLVGGAGNDVVVNYFTLGQLLGGAGDDVLEGGSDRDVMTGGSGADKFLFLADHGHDVVKDFTQGADKLVMVDFAASIADLTIRQQDGDARISFGGWSVLLKGVDSSTLTDSDFVFVQPNILQDAIDAFYAGWDFLP
jgi:Ca2+-binding RTX toxin-like protein